MKHQQIILSGLFMAASIASAATVDLYFWPATENGYVNWSDGTQWMYEDADGNQVLTNVKAQCDAKNSVNIIFDATKSGFKISNRTDTSAAGNATYNIVESITSIGIPTTTGTNMLFQGMKTYSSAKFTVKKNIDIQSGYFAINGFGYRQETFQSGSLDVQGQIKLSAVAGSTTTLCLGYNGSRSESLNTGQIGPLVSVSVGYVLDSNNDKVALDVSNSAGSKALYFNVGAHDNDYDTASLDKPDVLFNGILKGSDVLAGRTFVYGFNRGSVKAGTEVISCEGISGYFGIKNQGTPKDASATNIQIMTILLKNEAGKSYTMLYELADNFSATSNWDFADYVKTAVVMDGAGTQIIKANQRFSGGITVKQGSLFVNGKATGSTNDTYTHGDLDMQGGKFGIYNNSDGAGAFNFTDCYWKSGTISLGVYEDAVDTIILTGTLEAGSGELGSVFIEFEGEGCYALTTEKKIISWSGYDKENFSSESFKAEDMLNQITGETLKAFFRAEDDGLYIKYAAVPEASTMAAIFGVLALVLAVYRRRK